MTNIKEKHEGSQRSQSSDTELKFGLPEFETGVRTTKPQFSVSNDGIHIILLRNVALPSVQCRQQENRWGCNERACSAKFAYRKYNTPYLCQAVHFECCTHISLWARKKPPSMALRVTVELCIWTRRRVLSSGEIRRSWINGLKEIKIYEMV